MEYRPKRQRPDVQASDAEERREKRLLTPEHRSPHDRSGAPSEALRRSNEPGVRLAFYGQGIQNSGSFQVGGNLNIGVQDNSNKDAEFFAALRSTDPSDDRTRIQREKGGLLEDSYSWILDHADFRRWRDNEESRLLWIKGDPGKGKTMLLCGIIQELEKLPVDMRRLSYFFCQATDVRLSNATSVLRGLLYLLLDQEPSLMSHVRKKYNHAGKQLFEDANQWDALSKILINILQDYSRQSTFLIIDALDECVTNRDQLLDLLVHISSLSRAKLIVSSRNWQSIEEALNASTQKLRLCLELNHELISAAVGRYIEYKVGQLVRSKKYDDKTRVTVQQHLASNANGTFLWVALVCQELADRNVRKRHTLAKLQSFPPGLDSLYQRMMKHIHDSDDADLCKQILAVASVVYRPVSLKELTSLVVSLEDIGDDLDTLEEIIGSCGSLLTIREGVVYFVHQSAKDFVLNKASDQILPSGIAHQHRSVFTRSLEALSGTLRRDIYNLRVPGFSIDQVSPPDPDPLSSTRYSCIYWADHLNDSDPAQRMRDLQDGNIAHAFLKKKFLYWLEALSLLRSMSEGVLAMEKLAALVGNVEAQQVTELLQDARRFILSHKRPIEIAPLQVYASALVFSPTRSLVRQVFLEEEPDWIISKPIMEADWNACIQTLKGHDAWVNSVVFSADGQRLASGSKDKTIRIWDASSGACLQTLKGHDGWVNSVVFSADGQRLASGSEDKTIRVWDASSGACLQTLKGHDDFVNSVVFSADGQRLASGSEDKTIRVWDASSGACLQTLKGHDDFVNSVVFSADGQRLASSSCDDTIKTWDASSGTCLQTLKGHDGLVTSVVFSADSQRLASSSCGDTIKIWDASLGACLQTCTSHDGWVNSVVFSADGQRLASSCGDTIKIWDASSVRYKNHSCIALSGDPHFCGMWCSW
ncbi:uncharacterized protein BKA55DRAFT_66651 [Fusarium redolens]|uniref:NACHT domain-containing protein n=1 Tax=Fusarium redolens TaxID=48865 RepID=A0A9P9K841_FUSRE|nr:uncharacterized protein BKA55DRAFT_66651 [Fusarium redolens]KAH7247440.1 hypothetical protein BKA55DRAFT_66651 [Fusarium redolens]